VKGLGRWPRRCLGGWVGWGRGEGGREGWDCALKRRLMRGRGGVCGAAHPRASASGAELSRTGRMLSLSLPAAACGMGTAAAAHSDVRRCDTREANEISQEGIGQRGSEGKIESGVGPRAPQSVRV
jgi:hypothetical protein